MQLRLFHYWRSSSSWRVRWALAIKGLSCEFIPVNLLTDESEQESHTSRNPMGTVPVLEVNRPGKSLVYLSESTAILEWLEETFPAPSLFSGDPFERARIRQLAQIINSGIQPLQNPTVVAFHSLDPAEQKKWNQHWIRKGLFAYEKITCETSGKYSVGNSPTVADLFLIPQCYNAIRNDISLQEFKTIERIHTAALEVESCKATAPDRFKPKETP